MSARAAVVAIARSAAPFSVALVLLALAPRAEAGTGTLTGTIGKVPKSAAVAVVEAVDPRGRIGAVATPSASGAFHLSVPSGTYVVASSAAGEETSLSSFARPRPVPAGKRTRVHAKLEPERRPAAPSRGLLPKGAVLTVTGLGLTDNRVSPPAFTDLRELFLQDLFGPCTRAGYVFVDTSPQFVEFAEQETALSASGRLALPYEYHPLRPQYEIFGDENVNQKDFAGAPVEFALNLVATNVQHKEVRGSAINVEFDTPELVPGTEEAELGKAARRLAGVLCGA
ncbi:MAG: hypothetical protein JSR24_22305 [Proteobacteria bacterium]|nr:hypothetical protein [Pseudomonadota bacterium]